MRPALLVILVSVACTTPETGAATSATTSCDNMAACDVTSSARGLDNRHVHKRGSTTFTSADSQFSLVSYEYGDGADNTYASFVYEGEDYPLDVVFYDDALFNYDVYGCDPFWDNCAWPAYDLAIIDDPVFIDWVYSVDTWYTVDLQNYYDNYYDFRRAGRTAPNAPHGAHATH